MAVDLPQHTRLRAFAEALEQLNWAFFIADRDWQLTYVSKELAGFFGTDDPEALGIGKHYAISVLESPWLEKIPLEDQVRVFSEIAPHLFHNEDQRDRLIADIGEPFGPLLADIEPRSMPDIWASWFRWREGDLPPYRVDMAGSPIRDADGSLIGYWFVSVMGVRPRLTVLLARGNADMYERMGSLVEPKRRQAAILFVDLEGSSDLSRRLSTAAYFELIRKLATCIDDHVARSNGIIGKHAGDGASALFLVENLGSHSAAAAAAIKSARALQEMALELAPSHDPAISEPRLNFGLHWGANLYVGQLVPGGRLDVTALGDEMNECARIQQSARGGSILASKSLIEQLDTEDASAMGLEPQKISYRRLEDLPSASEKARRETGSVAVTTL